MHVNQLSETQTNGNFLSPHHARLKSGHICNMHCVNKAVMEVWKPGRLTLVQAEQLRTWLLLSKMAFLSITPMPFLNRAGSVQPSYLGPLSPLLTNQSYQAETPLQCMRKSLLLPLSITQKLGLTSHAQTTSQSARHVRIAQACTIFHLQYSHVHPQNIHVHPCQHQKSSLSQRATICNDVLLDKNKHRWLSLSLCRAASKICIR